ncbi:hypothetical protein QJS10_CPA16g01784 [Acorus calamus]|uniref:Uncharacterized protein n=1 Tax=Acorus calamus TaxID=4465 RepID=A0AAV9D0C1_ACOCL|nr:hypothetical protein QJS10_CPA16g01784 [Acorus calamus]
MKGCVYVGRSSFFQLARQYIIPFAGKHALSSTSPKIARSPDKDWFDKEVSDMTRYNCRKK